MTFLLDTRVLIWAASEPERLGDATELVLNEDCWISAASVWELAIKQGLGKLDLHAPVARWTERATRELRLGSLAVTTDHAAAVETLPPIHRDPFDRLLIAQARVEGATLLTADRTLAAYGAAVRLIE